MEQISINEKTYTVIRLLGHGKGGYSYLVPRNGIKPEYFEQVGEMCRILYDAGLNVDYYPTNFVVREELLYYIDYECNPYMDEWNFENWDIRYWTDGSAN